MRCCSLLAGCALVLLSASAADAQGLIWKLPEDGTWIRYEGTYKQLERRPESTEGDLTLQWQRNVEIKSVGREMAEHNVFRRTPPPEPEMCRWLEFKVVTGNVVEGIIDAGPGGTAIYKVLVPESEIRGQLQDEETIILSYLPVVKGYRKLGDEPPQPLESQVLHVHPTLSLLRYFRNLQSDGVEQTLEVPSVGSVAATAFKGNMQMETRINRSTSEGEILRSESLPFGVVKWTARTVIEEKNPTEPRSAFKETIQLTEELNAVEVGTGAESELVIEP
jgi:hypothetical protein